MHSPFLVWLTVERLQVWLDQRGLLPKALLDLLRTGEQWSLAGSYEVWCGLTSILVIHSNLPNLLRRLWPGLIHHSEGRIKVARVHDLMRVVLYNLQRLVAAARVPYVVEELLHLPPALLLQLRAEYPAKRAAYPSIRRVRHAVGAAAPEG